MTTSNAGENNAEKPDHTLLVGYKMVQPLWKTRQHDRIEFSPLQDLKMETNRNQMRKTN